MLSALSRRSKNNANQAWQELAQLVYVLNDTTSVLQHPSGASVKLTQRESQLLKGLICAEDQLLETWQVKAQMGIIDNADKNSVDILVHRLRKKLSKLGVSGSSIVMHRGLGYQLELNVEIH